MFKFLLLTVTLMILMSALCIAESDTLWVKEIGSEVRAVKFSPDGQFIYAAAIGRKPMKLDAVTGEILKEYEGFVFEGNVFFLAMDISSDGKWLICGAYGNDMYIFDTETGLIVKTLKTDYQDIQTNKFNTVTITPDKRYIIATNMFAISPQVSMNGIVIWDAVTGELIKVINSKDAMKVESSPDNLHFAVSYFDESPTDIKIYQVGTWEIVGSLCCHSNLIQDISYSPDGSLLASSDWSGAIKLWDMNQAKLLKEFSDDVYQYSIVFIDNEKFIIGGGFFKDKYLKIWSVNSLEFLGRLKIDHPLDMDINENKHYGIAANSTGILLFDYLSLITGINDHNIGTDDKTIPNPTNNSSEINFNLPLSGITNITITDLNSKIIEVLFNGFLQKGNHNFQWIPKGVSTGIYFCNIKSKTFSKTLKIILEK